MSVGVIVTSLICLYGILLLFIPSILTKLDLVYDDDDDMED